MSVNLAKDLRIIHKKKSTIVRKGDKIKILIIKEQTDLSDIFGILRASKINSQKVKDDLRKEWSKR